MKRALPTLPVRSIGVSGRSVTGIVPLMGRFESTLERDLMEIIRFDRRVSSFLPQPVKIEYKGDAGENRSYTPDGLITFQESASSPLPTLYEVKYRANFREQWRNLLPKFRAAKSYCAQRGWRFEVYTEREIRTPYLDNVKLLWPFRNREPSPFQRAQILGVFESCNEVSVSNLFGMLAPDPKERGELIPALWHLIANGAVCCDLNIPLSMTTMLSIGEVMR
ncbi:TnsA endonuclease N-terminal domain-containing protein [Pseudomonas viridiflava]|uniref:TnsA endonuclease N-terminal domain-containing protein n=1 Tax=Pseudomonas viridiflava TaxID=33069 RepID=UPI001F60CABB|nr:TnsA endonuclease N-terminal domain-containing protein [Pseudomonas viridiflava]MCI3910583.1 TnsA endonuclease N-terminal domain-containing protein [Pseudomonas viridiflava]